MSESTLKTCKSCRHFSSGDSGQTCGRFTEFDVVYGHEPTLARDARKSGGPCGLTAKGWEPRVFIPDWTVYVVQIIGSLGLLAYAIYLWRLFS